MSLLRPGSTGSGFRSGASLGTTASEGSGIGVAVCSGTPSGLSSEGHRLSPSQISSNNTWAGVYLSVSALCAEVTEWNEALPLHQGVHRMKTPRVSVKIHDKWQWHNVQSALRAVFA